MTAHAPKLTITPERVEWFARYYVANPAWGIFHACLDDGNWKFGVYSWEDPSKFPKDVLEHALWFNKITPSQRRRLGKKAEARAAELQTVKMSTAALVLEHGKARGTA